MSHQVYKCSRYTEPNPLQDLEYDLMVDPTGQQFVHFCSDIDYLLGIKSIEHLDPAMLRDLSSMHKAEPLPANVTDDDLVRFCKSRYVQEPADCQRWYDYLMSCAEDMQHDYDSVISDVLSRSVQEDSDLPSQSQQPSPASSD